MNEPQPRPVREGPKEYFEISLHLNPDYDLERRTVRWVFTQSRKESTAAEINPRSSLGAVAFLASLLLLRLCVNTIDTVELCRVLYIVKYGLCAR